MQYGRKRKMVCTDVLGRIEREVIKECSPTLAGLKTGNLFNYRYDNISDFRRELASVNRKLNAKGVYVTFLKRNEKSALLYVFRPDRLEKDLSQPSVQNVLKTLDIQIIKLEQASSILNREWGRTHAFHMK